MILFIQILSVLVIWLSFWSLIPRDEWWIRGADFPRLQILIIGFIALGLYIFWEHSWTLIDQSIFVGLVAAQAYQLKMVLPYTFIWKKQVKKVKRQQLDPSKQISLLVSNVLMTNEKYHLLLEQIQRLTPDLVLTLETNSEWQKQLSVIEADY